MSAGTIAVFGLLLFSAGCGSGAKLQLSEGSHEQARAAPPGRREILVSPPRRCLAGISALGTSEFAYALVVTSPTPAYSGPGALHVVTRLGTRDVNGFQTVLGVTAVRNGKTCEPAWYRVELPVLPNGTTGWVSAAAVRVFRVRSRIEVSLSERRLRVYRSGRLVLETRVGVGAPATPTPVGRFFVNERYVLSSAGGPFGPDALGISAHSPTLARLWVQQAPIGVHGTDEPSSIGEAASHGCIRVPNDAMRRVFSLAPAGTPVIVEA